MCIFEYVAGLSDYCDEGQFHWKSDGSEVAYNNWDSNEPNNYQDNEHCVHINGRNKWNDIRCLTEENACGNIMTAICQK